MESLWIGSDVDLSILRKCRMAERLEFRLECLRKDRTAAKNGSPRCKIIDEMGDGDEFESNIEGCYRRRRRSGTWPRTRSLNAPSPIQQFGPCGRIMKNSSMVILQAVVALFVASAICLFDRSFLSKVIPRYLTPDLHSINVPYRRMSFMFEIFLFLVKGTIVVFDELMLSHTE
ncbi:hypothetical protein Trydic_g11804 [Trypoxylus dichotomus]